MLIKRASVASGYEHADVPMRMWALALPALGGLLALTVGLGVLRPQAAPIAPDDPLAVPGISTRIVEFEPNRLPLTAFADASETSAR